MDGKIQKGGNQSELLAADNNTSVRENHEQKKMHCRALSENLYASLSRNCVQNAMCDMKFFQFKTYKWPISLDQTCNQPTKTDSHIFPSHEHVTTQNIFLTRLKVQFVWGPWFTVGKAESEKRRNSLFKRQIFRGSALTWADLVLAKNLNALAKGFQSCKDYFNTIQYRLLNFSALNSGSDW